MDTTQRRIKLGLLSCVFCMYLHIYFLQFVLELWQFVNFVCLRTSSPRGSTFIYLNIMLLLIFTKMPMWVSVCD